MARTERKAGRQALLKAVFAGLGLVTLIVAVSLSMTWLYGVAAALFATSVATGLYRRPQNNTAGPAPHDTQEGPTGTGEPRRKPDDPPPHR